MKENEMRFILHLQLFAENEEKEVVIPEVEITPQKDSEYLNVIKDLQDKLKNTVSKDKYDEVLKDKNELKDIVLNGGGALPNEDNKEEEVDTVSLTKQILNPENQFNNLEYIKNVLTLRNAKLKQDGVDIFASKPEERKDAQETAEALQYCVDQANGDSGVFTAVLQSILVDDENITRLLRQNMKRR